MFTIQQINDRKKHHFKFLEITKFQIYTNQQINQVDDNSLYQNPESTGPVVLQGLTLVDGVTYTLTL